MKDSNRDFYKFLCEELGEDLESVFFQEHRVLGYKITDFWGSFCGYEFVIRYLNKGGNQICSVRMEYDDDMSTVLTACNSVQKYLGGVEPSCAFELLNEQTGSKMFGVEWGRTLTREELETSKEISDFGTLNEFYEDFDVEKGAGRHLVPDTSEK